MDTVQTHYIDRDGSALAYQVIGDGPVDIVSFCEITQHLDLMWTDPGIHHLYERAANYSRAVYFQRRGFGLSDRVTYTPTVEQQADDVLAIMDAVGMHQATLVGILGTCAALSLVAAKAPERVTGMVFTNPYCQGAESGGEIHGWAPDELARFIDGYREAYARWGSGSSIAMWDPVLATAYNRRLVAMLERSSATPAAALAHFEWAQQIDIQDLLPSVQVPVRVLHVPGSPFAEGASRYVADLLPGGSFHVLPPNQRGSSLGEAWIPVSDHIEEVATGTHHTADADRFLGTVLFTDVVSSTELLSRVGDAAYRGMRASHERLVRLAVEEHGGHIVDVTGDGTLSVFDGPSKAVHCAETICEEAQEVGITVRAGIHTGELERDSLRITGITVHIGARVGAAAAGGEVLVSRTVHDLVVGSGLRFASRGEQELKGIPGRWELFAVTHTEDQKEALPVEESMQTPMDRFALYGARRAPRFSRAAVRLGNAMERRRARVT